MGIVRLVRLARLLFGTWLSIRALGVVCVRRGLVYAFLIAGVLILAGSGIFVVMEPETVHGDFSTALWLAVGIATTARYGDLATTGMWGRVIPVVLSRPG